MQSETAFTILAVCAVIQTVFLIADKIMSMLQAFAFKKIADEGRKLMADVNVEIKNILEGAASGTRAGAEMGALIAGLVTPIFKGFKSGPTISGTEGAWEDHGDAGAGARV